MTPTTYTGWYRLYEFVSSVASYDARYRELRDFCMKRIRRYSAPVYTETSTLQGRKAFCKRKGLDVDYLSRPRQDLTVICKQRVTR